MDDLTPLGVVGERYVPIQNSVVWEWVNDFQTQTGATLETAGALFGGKKTFIALRNGTVEYVNGDTIQKYFLVSNSFDGKSPMHMLFTDVRVVCNNTLTAAIGGAANIYKIRHTASGAGRMDDALKALNARERHDKAMDEAMHRLVDTQLVQSKVDAFLNDCLFPAQKAELVAFQAANTPEARLNSIFDMVETGTSPKAQVNRAETMRQNTISTILDLVDHGQGTDIPGVRGTAYGLFQAITEYSDHHSRTRAGNAPEADLRFNSNLWGSSAEFKQEALGKLMKFIN
jgi:phage/plasmid-like protein (TIGR03299 family)